MSVHQNVLGSPVGYPGSVGQSHIGTTHCLEASDKKHRIDAHIPRKPVVRREVVPLGIANWPWPLDDGGKRNSSSRVSMPSRLSVLWFRVGNKVNGSVAGKNEERKIRSPPESTLNC